MSSWQQSVWAQVVDDESVRNASRSRISRIRPTYTVGFKRLLLVCVGSAKHGGRDGRHGIRTWVSQRHQPAISAEPAEPVPRYRIAPQKSFPRPTIYRQKSAPLQFRDYFSPVGVFHGETFQCDTGSQPLPSRYVHCTSFTSGSVATDSLTVCHSLLFARAVLDEVIIWSVQRLRIDRLILRQEHSIEDDDVELTLNTTSRRQTNH